MHVFGFVGARARLEAQTSDVFQQSLDNDKGFRGITPTINMVSPL